MRREIWEVGNVGWDQGYAFKVIEKIPSKIEAFIYVCHFFSEGKSWTEVFPHSKIRECGCDKYTDVQEALELTENISAANKEVV